MLEEASSCDVFKTNYTTLLVVVPNIADIVDLSLTENNCSLEHPPFSLPSGSDKKNFFQKYTKSLSSSKKIFESNNKNVHVIFSFFPLLYMETHSKTMFIEQKKKFGNASIKCTCSYQKLKIQAKFLLNEKYQNLVGVLNQHIFLKEWTQYGRNPFYWFFDFTPYSVKYLKHNWIPSCNDAKILNGYNFNDSLHCFLYGINSRCSFNPSVLCNSALDAFKKYSKSTFKVYVIGDEWLHSVAEIWPFTSSVKPLFCIDSSLYLGSNKNLISRILSLTRKDEQCLIVCCPSLRSFASFEEFKGCKGHKPLKYAMYKNDLRLSPKLFAEAMNKDVKDVGNAISKRRSSCKIVFSTNFPLYFYKINKYLCIRHKEETGHDISSSAIFDLFDGLLAESPPLEMINSSLYDINLNLNNINYRNGFETLHINSICKEFANATFNNGENILPFYEIGKVPPPALARDFSIKMRDYIELHMQLIKCGKIVIHSNEYDKTRDAIDTEKEIMLETMAMSNKDNTSQNLPEIDLRQVLKRKKDNISLMKASNFTQKSNEVCAVLHNADEAEKNQKKGNDIKVFQNYSVDKSPMLLR